MRWNHNLAYVVGIITTDGNLSPDGRHITVTSTDKHLLETTARCINKSNSITLNTPGSLSKKPTFRIQFGDVKLYNQLEKIGLRKNKSLSLDGSIINYTDKYLSHINEKYVYDRLFVYFISSSPNHVAWLQHMIYSTFLVKGSISSNLPKNQVGSHPLFRLKFSTKEAKTLVKKMYYRKHLPCLRRKFLIPQKYL